MEQEKNDLAILTENLLYRSLALCDENDKFSSEERQKAKTEIKEMFIKEVRDRFKMMTEEEIREHINYVIERTRRNKEEMKRAGNDEER